MRLSNLPLTTFKEVPADAEVASHQLMLRAGLIRRLASGLFTWMPLGLRVLRKVENVVREEMNASGAFELLKRAYIDARYKMDEYEITKEELEHLSDKVSLLKELTGAICKEKIKEIAKG